MTSNFQTEFNTLLIARADTEVYIAMFNLAKLKKTATDLNLKHLAENERQKLRYTNQIQGMARAHYLLTGERYEY